MVSDLILVGCVVIWVFSFMLSIVYTVDSTLSPSFFTIVCIFIPILNTVYLIYLLRKLGYNFLLTKQFKRFVRELKDVKRL